MRRLTPHHSSGIGIISCALLFFLLVLGGPRAAYAAPIYSLQILGSLSGTSAAATAVNSNGTGVGFITATSGSQIPVLFNGQTDTLSGIGQANGINGSGTVVGTTFASNNPFVTTWLNGQATNLGIAGYGTGISNSGQVVGGLITSNGPVNAFVSTNGNVVNLGTLPGGAWSTATAINNAGQIVGNSANSKGQFSAFLSSGTGMTSLCPSCPASSYAYAINPGGTVVGSFVNSSGYLNAAEYSAGNAIDLGTLGGTLSAAYGIDSAGDIVGYSYTTNNVSQHAFLYTNGVMLDLNNLLPVGSNWEISAAYGITSQGDIIADASTNGQSYAIELTPSSLFSSEISSATPLSTPEPVPFLLTGAGLLFIAGKFWK